MYIPRVWKTWKSPGIRQRSGKCARFDDRSGEGQGNVLQVDDDLLHQMTVSVVENCID